MVRGRAINRDRRGQGLEGSSWGTARGRQGQKRRGSSRGLVDVYSPPGFSVINHSHHPIGLVAT